MTTCMILLIISCFCTNPFLSLATDTILATQSLSGNQTIVSSGGRFELGFFTPGKSCKYYIGIWYKEITPKTVVWVANRDSPVLYTHSAQFKISGGDLVLLNESQIPIWSTGLNSPHSHSSTVFAVLLDNGNLILQEKVASESNSTPDATVWESLDHPTDTWMPGAKLSYDKITRRKHVLTSWTSFDDPAPGLFSFELDPNKFELILRWNGGELCWTTGDWNDYFLVRVPIKLQYIFKFNCIDNENESYFTYSLYNPASISRMIIDTYGQISLQMWMDNTTWMVFWPQPLRSCHVYAYCGAFYSYNYNPNYAEGGLLPSCNCLEGIKIGEDQGQYPFDCVRETTLECQNSVVSTWRRDKFLVVPNVSLPYSFTLRTESIGKCESMCLTSCSCTAYVYDENGCAVWYGGELFNNLEQVQGKTIYIRYSEFSSVFRGPKNHVVLVIWAVLGPITMILIILAIPGAVIWNQGRQKRTGVSTLLEGSLVGFSYQDLRLATKNFSFNLGGGGYGSVFKGTLPDSTVIAVKKLESINQGEKQFRAEVNSLGMIQHINLVRLRGFCPEHNQKLLVYDYMENGSLNSHLFNVKGSTVLDWKLRYQIALGIARGLTYLHDKCRECIIHCDIKPENILLDGDYCPKVGDFGLAKLMDRDFSKVLTTIRGTRGYLAPEWISGDPITTKADVYSYGKLLFELVSGSRNSEYVEDGKGEYFPYLAACVVINGGDILGLLDPILERNGDVEEVLKVCKVGCWCIQDEENMRPSMSEIVYILEGVIDVSLPPIPRALELIFSANKEKCATSSTSEAKSSAYSSVLSDSLNLPEAMQMPAALLPLSATS